MLEKISRVVAQVAGLDVLRRNPLVDIVLHIVKRFHEQVAAGLVRVGAELGETGANDRHLAGQPAGACSGH